MDYNRLEIFLDIASTGNLSITAKHFGYTQSAVSHSVKKLESEIGFTLLKRTNRGVELTDDGKSLLPYVRSAVTASRHLDEEIQAICGIMQGEVSIGTYSSIAINWLPAVIRRFQNQYPGVSVQIREGGLNEIEQWMQEGSVDFGLLSCPQNRTFEFTELTSEPLYAVFPPEYELPGKYSAAFPVSAFNDYPFITSESGMDDDVAAALNDAGVKPHVAFYCKDDHSIMAMVENGLGISLLPSLILTGHEKKLKKVPLDPPASRILGTGAVSPDSLSLSALAFIRITTDYVKNLPDISQADTVTR